MAKELHDNVSRVKASSPLGSAIFVGLRAADVFWQYSFLQRGWASKLIERFGGNSVGLDRILDPSTSQLQPYYLLVCLMALGSSLKQIVALVYISEQEMPAASAFVIAAFNTIFNSLNTILSLWSPTSGVHTSRSWFDILRSSSVAIGAGFYLIGILMELISELQRRAFKKNPANKGKPYGGFSWGILTFSFFFYDFSFRGFPVLDQYLTERYGEAYEEIKTRVKYSLFPGIY
ncbi:hypothetical protein LIPSTDRAFT_121047 [Lipomyces starkeyi NRRL Y-11557]|uniref:Steroid 5-alpha reductase C-terminal domain-containing protein n=1 Tax=Lipomyces starkeyi NRRL Y-11557 TaxID=675824 RepID=A0A1E3PUE2_LIPST|nr:hypothetical protein LIPSTDRAFT_121047 [Lipomyces starkeyi NRRL Y-11557]